MTWVTDVPFMVTDTPRIGAGPGSESGITTYCLGSATHLLHIVLVRLGCSKELCTGPCNMGPCFNIRINGTVSLCIQTKEHFKVPSLKVSICPLKTWHERNYQALVRMTSRHMSLPETVSDSVKVDVVALS